MCKLAITTKYIQHRHQYINIYIWIDVQDIGKTWPRDMAQHHFTDQITSLGAQFILCIHLGVIFADSFPALPPPSKSTSTKAPSITHHHPSFSLGALLCP